MTEETTPQKLQQMQRGVHTWSTHYVKLRCESASFGSMRAEIEQLKHMWAQLDALGSAAGNSYQSSNPVTEQPRTTVPSSSNPANAEPAGAPDKGDYW